MDTLPDRIRDSHHPDIVGPIGNERQIEQATGLGRPDLRRGHGAKVRLYSVLHFLLVVTCGLAIYRMFDSWLARGLFWAWECILVVGWVADKQREDKEHVGPNTLD